MGYLGLVVVAGFVIWSLLSERKRKKQIRNYAQSAGLTYIGAALPKSFPLSQTSVSRASSIKNVVAGDTAKNCSSSTVSWALARVVEC